MNRIRLIFCMRKLIIGCVWLFLVGCVTDGSYQFNNVNFPTEAEALEAQDNLIRRNLSNVKKYENTYKGTIKVSVITKQESLRYLTTCGGKLTDDDCFAKNYIAQVTHRAFHSTADGIKKSELFENAIVEEKQVETIPSFDNAEYILYLHKKDKNKPNQEIEWVLHAKGNEPKYPSYNVNLSDTEQLSAFLDQINNLLKNQKIKSGISNSGNKSKSYKSDYENIKFKD